jgi:acetylglutamate kinase
MKKTMVLKIGGGAFENEEGLNELALAIKDIYEFHFIIVHGGGIEISKALEQSNRQTTFVDGLRVTTAEDMEIVEKVLSENVNKRIADSFNEAKVPSKRMSGKKDKIFYVEQLIKNGKNLGFVGKIVKTDIDPVSATIQAELIPIISPISSDCQNRSFNVNADAAAAILAGKMKSEMLVYFTNVNGILINNKTINKISIKKAKEFIKKDLIKDGMVEKLSSVYDALNEGVKKVQIVQWRGKNTLKELLNNTKNFGTTIYL